jgi:hypothetical protein
MAFPTSDIFALPKLESELGPPHMEAVQLLPSESESARPTHAVHYYTRQLGNKSSSGMIIGILVVFYML